MNHWLNVAVSLKYFTVTGNKYIYYNNSKYYYISIFTITQYIIIYYDIFTASF